MGSVLEGGARSPVAAGEGQGCKVRVSPEEETSCLSGEVGVSIPPAPSPYGFGTDQLSLTERRL